MGKGRIIEEIGDGLYRIELDKGAFECDVQLSQINELLQGEEMALLRAEVEVIDAENALRAEVAELNRLIDELNNPPEAEPSDDEDTEESEPEPPPESIADRINDAVLEVERARSAVNQVRRRRADMVMQIAELKLKRDELETLEVAEPVEAWCTDGETEITGEVGTVEVPGEPIGPILIKPGFGGAAGYSPADGQLMQRALQSGAQAYLNAALLPGWHKYRPTYRFGTITVLNESENLCNVQLDPAVSSAQRLPVNAQSALSGVPIIYRECNARAFREGDAVLVEFSGQRLESPRVIGFKEYPRSCGVYFCFSYAYGSGSETRYNYAIYDETTMTRVKGDNRKFEEGNELYSIMRMGPVLQASGTFQYVPAFLNFDAGITFADLGTLAASGYPVTGEGGRWILQYWNPVSDGVSYYGIGDTQTKAELRSADYHLTKINPNTYQISHYALIIDDAEGSATNLSEPWGGFIAVAGMIENPYYHGFWDIFETETLTRVKRIMLGDTSDFTEGGALCLSSHGLLVVTFSGRITLYTPPRWSDPSGDWGHIDLGNSFSGNLFPAALIESAVSTDTDAYLLCDGLSSSTGYFTVRYNYAEGTFENLGFMGASGLDDSGPSNGFIRTHKRLYE